MNYHSFLFNFSASYSGGGLKRLMGYSRWFNEKGGASFIVNHRLENIQETFPANKYYFLTQNSFDRVINSSEHLHEIILNVGTIDFYYSYGIPLPGKIGHVNWFHLSNVLPLEKGNYHVPLKRLLELRVLGRLIRNSLKYADVISAESFFSLTLFDKSLKDKLHVSVNGSDDEINEYQQLSCLNTPPPILNNIAVAVGTYYYKCIDDVYKVYLHLRKSNSDLSLVIVGIEDYIPRYILKDPLVIAQGLLPHSEVCKLLKHARYYVTATTIENSYNAASEGVFLANESLLSDIGPHRELLKDMSFHKIDNIGTRLPILFAKRIDMNDKNLKSWDQVVTEMMRVVQSIK